MHSEQIYALGYAVPEYNINSNCRFWRYKNERWIKTNASIPLKDLDGVAFKVATIDDVKANRV